MTDPAGKTRRSLLDGLGRLVRVDEPTGSPGALGATGSPNQATSYSYNALDNLTRVTQGSQTRTFAYDSLSRLTSASNPENRPSPTGVSFTYTYDNNGNLTQRTDARSVVTSYTYDRLDRLTRRSYRYAGSDTAVSLETTQVDYAYDSCGSYSEGRLCSVTAKKGSTTEVSRTAYNRYDALGRVLESTQTTEKSKGKLLNYWNNYVLVPVYRPWFLGQTKPAYSSGGPATANTRSRPRGGLLIPGWPGQSFPWLHTNAPDRSLAL